MICNLDIFVAINLEDVAPFLVNRQAPHHVPPIEFEIIQLLMYAKAHVSTLGILVLKVLGALHKQQCHQYSMLDLAHERRTAFNSNHHKLRRV